MVFEGGPSERSLSCQGDIPPKQSDKSRSVTPPSPSKSTPISLHQTMLGVLNESLRHQQPSVEQPFQLVMSDLQILHGFHQRSILTLGSDRSRYLYQNASLKLALQVRRPLALIWLCTLLNEYLDVAPLPPACGALVCHAARAVGRISYQADITRVISSLPGRGALQPTPIQHI
jgi:hypothetical protein